MDIKTLLNNKYALFAAGFILGSYLNGRNSSSSSSISSFLNNDNLIIIVGFVAIYVAYKKKLEGFSNNNLLKNLELATNIKLDAMCQNEYGIALDTKKVNENITYNEFKQLKLREHSDNPTACSQLAMKEQKKI
jgi:hypothetical protein